MGVPPPRHGCKWNFTGPQMYSQPARIQLQHFGGFAETFGLEFEVLRMLTTYVSKFFISSMFPSDNQLPKIGISDNLHTYMYI